MQNHYEHGSSQSCIFISPEQWIVSWTSACMDMGAREGWETNMQARVRCSPLQTSTSGSVFAFVYRNFRTTVTRGLFYYSQAYISDAGTFVRALNCDVLL